jgi:adenine-specific DNA-methyltransferase
MTCTFDYYELNRPEDGVAGGLKYKTVPHITLKNITNNEPPTQETLYDQPIVDKSKIRVTGPFTMEAVPAPVVEPLEGSEQPPAADASLAREGATVREADWRAELQRAGILLKGGKRIAFTQVEPLPGSRYLHAVGTTDDGKMAVMAFGPDHAPMEQKYVELAYTEARQLKPDYIVYAAFQFDPEAAKDIDELNPKLLGFAAMKVAMNPDLLTADLRKKQSGSQSFWLLGRPDIVVRKLKDGADKGKWQVEVRGFDYLNPATSELESGGTDRVAMWLLDNDYDDRSLFPRQVFFPLAGDKDGWNKLRKDLKAQLNEDMLEAFTGCLSLPFEGEAKKTRIAIKMVDNRGLESLRVLTLDETALD